LSKPGVIWADFLAKPLGLAMDLGPASLTFRDRDSFTGGRGLEAYERDILDAMLGDHSKSSTFGPGTAGDADECAFEAGV
jgi:glucose-6-phosphate 1-dehydrogenase